MFESDCVYISSDELHSKNAPKSSSSTMRMVVVAHKNQKSFDRSTKRILRSTKQIWTSYVTGDDNYSVSDAYLIFGSGRNKASASLHERLAKEFKSTGVCAPVEVNNAINAIRFNVDIREDGLNVIFINLDSLSLTPSDISVSEMQTLLDSIVITLVDSKRVLLHIKSDIISRAITSMLSDDTKESLHQINGKELKSFLCAQEQTIIKSHLTGDLIRRLNKKNESSNCPLTKYPTRYIQNKNERREICRFHNFDKERGCLRSIKALHNKNLKGCDLDHDHCYQCGEKGHKAYECTKSIDDVNKSVVFEEREDGIIAIPINNADDLDRPRDVPVPSLLVLGGRCRGRTLNSCEFLPLSSSNNSWISLPNLQEHRGSHAACAPRGVPRVFVVGGGGVDGNLDTVELLDVKASRSTADKGFKWHTMPEKLSSARHAFGAVCVTRTDASDANEIDVDVFAVGGWMYGTKSCESMEKLSFKVSRDCNKLDWQNDSRWVKCSPIPTPRRLHSVAASITSIFVFGGYIDERKVTNSIESYDIKTDTWSAPDKLPYPEESCPLVQAVQDLSSGAKNSFIIFPYSDSNTTKQVLRYTPSCATKFEPIVVPKQEGAVAEYLEMPIKNWHSFSATLSSSLQTVYVVGGLIDSKWTSRGFSLDLRTMTWQELPDMLLPRRRLAAVIIE